MKAVIVASVIATSQQELDERYSKIAPYVDRIQIDVMDGVFVKSHSLNFPHILPSSQHARHAKLHKPTIEAHLMMADPLPWIHNYGKEVDVIIFHVEIVGSIPNSIAAIRHAGKKVGIALAPYTDVDAIIPYLDEVDMVLIFTADRIGYYGAAFSQASLMKVEEIRRMKPSLPIEVDGGITINTIAAAVSAGATQCVIGSFLQKSENISETLRELYEVIA